MSFFYLSSVYGTHILNCSVIIRGSFLSEPFIGLIISGLEMLRKIFWKLYA